MSQNFKELVLDEIAREQYLPVLKNQISVKTSAFYAQIKKSPLVGGIVKSGAPLGVLGGFGFSEEGRETPKAGRQRYQGFKSEPKDMYLDLTISYKATKLATEKGALVNALDSEIRAAYETAKWHTGRSLYGNGTGILANTLAMDGVGNTVAVDSTKYLIEGMTVDFYAEGATTDDEPIVPTRRIKHIDRKNKTVTFDGSAVTLAKGFMTVQNSYGLEITGLGAIFDDSIDTIYGVSKKDNPIIKPVVIDCENDINNSIIWDGLRDSSEYKNGSCNMLLCGNTAYRLYSEYLNSSNVRVEGQVGELVGGWKAIKYLFGERDVSIVSDRFVPDNEIWGVNTDDFDFQSTDWEFVTKDGGIFNLMENQSVYRALLANYGDLICKNPGACIRYKNIA